MYREIKDIKLALNSICIYRDLFKSKVLCKFYSLIDYISKDEIEISEFLTIYNNFFVELINSNKNYSLKDYIIHNIIYDENLYSIEIAKGINPHELIKKSVLNDLHYLKIIAEFEASVIKEYILDKVCKSSFEIEIIANLPEYKGYKQNASDLDIVNAFYGSRNWRECLEPLSIFYKNNGIGVFAKYKAFVWEKEDNNSKLKGIENADQVRFSDLIGYELEREKVVQNTIHFLKGRPANNMLLYGDRGTGKSSTVKALINEYYKDRLRLIEVPKKRLVDFPKIIRKLTGLKLKFIIFVDDLAFEDNEENYTALKAILEGGIESKPENVLIYATSNRRHLIKEKFSDRMGLQSNNMDDEVRAADTMEEKLSLSDRFGITVVFSSPDKKTYLNIVDGLVQRRGLIIDKESLHKEAMKWELWYNGRSPRTARQFVDWLEGNLNQDVKD